MNTRWNVRMSHFLRLGIINFHKSKIKVWETDLKKFLSCKSTNRSLTKWLEFLRVLVPEIFKFTRNYLNFQCSSSDSRWNSSVYISEKLEFPKKFERRGFVEASRLLREFLRILGEICTQDLVQTNSFGLFIFSKKLNRQSLSETIKFEFNFVFF